MLRPLAIGSIIAAMLVAPGSAQAGQPEKDAENQRICKITEQTGSRLAKHKVCMTRKAWKAEEDAQARELRDNQDAGVKTTTDVPRPVN